MCTEFLGLMKKVSKSPLVMDVLNIPNVQKQLERLADLLSKIQKALGEYLERERSSFPRLGWCFLEFLYNFLKFILRVIMALTKNYLKNINEQHKEHQLSHPQHHNYRFYFVGDEDLLEIIGNSKNVPRLQKHFKKMFAGVYAIILEEEDTLITGISSKEGEEVGSIYSATCVYLCCGRFYVIDN